MHDSQSKFHANGTFPTLALWAIFSRSPKQNQRYYIPRSSCCFCWWQCRPIQWASHGVQNSNFRGGPSVSQFTIYSTSANTLSLLIPPFSFVLRSNRWLDLTKYWLAPSGGFPSVLRAWSVEKNWYKSSPPDKESDHPSIHTTFKTRRTRCSVPSHYFGPALPLSN